MLKHNKTYDCIAILRYLCKKAALNLRTIQVIEQVRKTNVGL